MKPFFFKILSTWWKRNCRYIHNVAFVGIRVKGSPASVHHNFYDCPICICHHGSSRVKSRMKCHGSIFHHCKPIFWYGTYGWPHANHIKYLYKGLWQNTCMVNILHVHLRWHLEGYQVTVIFTIPWSSNLFYDTLYYYCERLLGPDAQMCQKTVESWLWRVP